jgi:predicted amidohydrolase
MATDGGRARSEVVRLALAQVDCALGDVAENARRVRQALAAPTARSADVVVFP